MSKNLTWKGMLASSLGVILLMSGCSSTEDDSAIESDPFYQDALVSADLSLLNQYWSIYEVNYQQQTAEIPKTYGNCDRDFFTFLNDGVYKDYLIPNSACIPEEQNLQWRFDKGVITLENSFKDYNEMVIVKLTVDQFVFKAKYDFDDDGEEEIFQFLAKPYRPNEAYFYGNSLIKDEAVTNKIKLTWSEYQGINNFEKYEIYLSDQTCELAKSTLVATITDKGTTVYEDADPPVETFFCYFLKVYTDKGLLFTSYSVGISPEYLDVKGVNLQQPVVQNEKIFLQWEKYDGLYFSHYEVVVKNYLGGSGSIYQEKTLLEISDINTTNFTDETPPYIKNPVYEIRVHNKFGKQNYYNPQAIISAREANYLPEKVIDLQNIFDIAHSPDETVVYLNGGKHNINDTYIIRYNYVTRRVEAVSNTKTNPNGNGRNGLTVVNSSIGKELMYLKYDGITVFDQETLKFKYDLKLNNYGSLDDFIYLGNGRYILLDAQYVYTVSRDFANLTLLDKQEHFSQGQSQSGYHVLQINEGRIIIGNRDKAQSVIFNIDASGNLTDKMIIDIPITARTSKETVFNPRDNTIINFRENRIYSLLSGSLKSFEQPYLPLAINADGRKILGTNNDPEWNIDPESLHEKKVRTLDLINSNLSLIETEGYPHYLFENHLGQIISLSTYFKRQNPNYAYERPDFFTEIVK
ncbi:hypothetical protein [Sediminicola sp. 1XM1-17]|uniref:hypothetical protein n=1 Tax=Sediminicola sp. 1XM1-17 TaxID=3127702 RepID=UPI003078225C